jgi:hypothetical protein
MFAVLELSTYAAIFIGRIVCFAMFCLAADGAWRSVLRSLFAFLWA